MSSNTSPARCRTLWRALSYSKIRAKELCCVCFKKKKKTHLLMFVEFYIQVPFQKGRGEGEGNFFFPHK